MSEMVERVAVAIAGITEPMEAARAAIEAMREPTEAMTFSGDFARDADYGPASYIWRAMIDEALK